MIVSDRRKNKAKYYGRSTKKGPFVDLKLLEKVQAYERFQ
jgi:hypothetical protein